MDTMLQVLKGLPATTFENLVYDLLSLNGLRNAVWRTPGTDMGRDIEGDVYSVDFSGSYTAARWYVECKRYKSSVNWPTVWKKLAYADSQGADYLLIVTTAHLSPQCKSEISLWNTGSRRPLIRAWDASSVESAILQHPSVVQKYRLPGAQQVAVRSFLSLSRGASKLVQSAYGHAVLAEAVSPALEAAAAFSELLTVELESFESGLPHRVSPFSPQRDQYHWLEIEEARDEVSTFDRYALRAAVSFIRHIYNLTSLRVSADVGVISISVPADLTTAAVEVLAEVAVLGDFELALQNCMISLRSRRRT